MYSLSNGSNREPPTRSPFPEIGELFINNRNLRADEHPFPTAGSIEEMVFIGGSLNLKLLGGSSTELGAGNYWPRYTYSPGQLVS